MLVTCKLPAGKQISIPCNSGTTIAEIKETLESKHNFASSSLELIFCGRMLSDQDTVLDADCWHWSESSWRERSIAVFNRMIFMDVETYDRILFHLPKRLVHKFGFLDMILGNEQIDACVPLKLHHPSCSFEVLQSICLLLEHEPEFASLLSKANDGAKELQSELGDFEIQRVMRLSRADRSDAIFALCLCKRDPFDAAIALSRKEEHYPKHADIRMVMNQAQVPYALAATALKLLNADPAAAVSALIQHRKEYELDAALTLSRSASVPPAAALWALRNSAGDAAHAARALARGFDGPLAAPGRHGAPWGLASLAGIEERDSDLVAALAGVSCLAAD